ncbi:hypothetical protein GQ457_14G018530 [Hibiscus cannabinus]
MNDVNEARGEDEIVVEEDHSDSDFHDSEYEIDEGDDAMFEQAVDVLIERDSGHLGDEGNESNNDVICFSDDLYSIEGFDNEEVDKPNKKWPEFNYVADMDDPIFSVGMLFADKKQLKVAVKNVSIKDRVNVVVKKDDKIRFRVVCKEGCDWTLYARKFTKDANDPTFQIRTYKSKHTCCKDYANRNMDYKWLCNKYMHCFLADPNFKLSSFESLVYKDYVLIVPRSKLFRAKQLALKTLQGNYSEQYSKIGSYAEEIRNTNPGSSVLCKLDGGLFQRMYVSFKACVSGLAHCRPFISIDGCHLKGKFGGQLLSVVGVDANDCIFPIAYAVVEIENTDTWKWFINLLSEDINIENQHSWTWMSDRQKGLISALQSLFPEAEHRFCVRHLHNNFKNEGFQGKGLKDAIWAAARASNMADFNHCMDELKAKNSDAHKWLSEKPTKAWSRSHFSTLSKCDMLLNNLCECFNKYILDARDKPILTIVLNIRCKLMNRFYVKRIVADKFSGPLCPRIQKKLDKNKEISGRYWPQPSTLRKFQIICPINQFIVDLDEKSCSCRKWDLSGIPCAHAISAIWFNKEHPEAYVDACYTVDTQKKIYEEAINPIRGKTSWPSSTFIPKPPIQQPKQPGRPKMKRKKESDELTPQKEKFAKLMKIGVSMTCSKCGQQGHNKRSCKVICQNMDSQQSNDVRVLSFS